MTDENHAEGSSAPTGAPSDNHGSDQSRPKRETASPAANPASDSPDAVVLEQLRWVLGSWKHAVESKDWAGFMELVGLREIFVAGEPRERGEIVGRLSQVTAKLCDFEVIYGEFLRKKISPTSANLSFTARVLWTSSDNWEDQELDIVAHVGFELQREAWKTSYLLLDRPPAGSKPATPPVSAREAAGSSARPSASPTDRPPIGDRVTEAAMRYFASVGFGTPPAGQPVAGTRYAGGIGGQQLPTAGGGKKHIVYLPVIMDEDLIRDLFS